MTETFPTFEITQNAHHTLTVIGASNPDGVALWVQRLSLAGFLVHAPLPLPVEVSLDVLDRERDIMRAKIAASHGIVVVPDNGKLWAKDEDLIAYARGLGLDTFRPDFGDAGHSRSVYALRTGPGGAKSWRYTAFDWKPGDAAPIDRPNNCRNALRDAGYPYPKSGCDACKSGGLWGCPYETKDAVR